MRELAELIRALEGVDAVDVLDSVNGTPDFQVRMTPGADAENVGQQIDDLLARFGRRPRFEEPDIQPADEAPPPPPEQTRTTQATRPIATPVAANGDELRVSTEEGDAAVSVIVEVPGRGAGRRTVVGGHRLEAVAAATLEALGHASADVISISDHEVDGKNAITAIVRLPDGGVLAGASPVGESRLSATAMAVARALSG